jgi:hypothetical protein
MIAIQIEKRPDDIKAYVVGEPGKWGCGRTAPEAIGGLVLAHRETFNIEIQFPPVQDDKKKT